MSKELRDLDWPNKAPKDLGLRLLDAFSYSSCSADDLWAEIRDWLIENEVPVNTLISRECPDGALPINDDSKIGQTGQKGKGMELTQLIYTSRHDDTSSTLLDEILQVSRANNVRDGITGALIISKDSFLQLLEGERSAVGKCFVRITQDRRHRDIHVVSSADVEHRLFYEWSMHRIETSKMKEEILSRYKINGVYQPARMRQFAIEDMCRTLSQGHWQSLVA